MRDPTLLGAVLAGGESRRFGSPKALAPFEGEAMVIRALRTVSEAAGNVVVVTSVPRVREALIQEDPEIRTVPDRIPGAGPLAGLHAALHHAADQGLEGVLLLACDMPLVSAPLLARVAREGRRVGRPAAVPVGPTGRGEPLCAWYALESLRVVERRLEGDDRSMAALLEELEPLRVAMEPQQESGRIRKGVSDAELRSANTPGELSRLERLGEHEPGETLSTVRPAVLVVGFKDVGKTTVAVGLVAELRARGLRVGALKHGHRFQLDLPGTDSWRLAREGGADPVLLAGPEGFAFMGSWDSGRERSLGELLARHFHRSDVVVVEGYKREPFPRVEVHRVGSGAPILCVEGGAEEGSFLALVVDDPDGLEGPVPVPVLHRNDPGLSRALADLIEAEVLGRRPAGSGGP